MIGSKISHDRVLGSPRDGRRGFVSAAGTAQHGRPVVVYYVPAGLPPDMSALGGPRRGPCTASGTAHRNFAARSFHLIAGMVRPRCRAGWEATP